MVRCRETSDSGAPGVINLKTPGASGAGGSGLNPGVNHLNFRRSLRGSAGEAPKPTQKLARAGCKPAKHWSEDVLINRYQIDRSYC